MRAGLSLPFLALLAPALAAAKPPIPLEAQSERTGYSHAHPLFKDVTPRFNESDQGCLRSTLGPYRPTIREDRNAFLSRSDDFTTRDGAGALAVGVDDANKTKSKAAIIQAPSSDLAFQIGDRVRFFGGRGGALATGIVNRIRLQGRRHVAEIVYVNSAGVRVTRIRRFGDLLKGGYRETAMTGYSVGSEGFRYVAARPSAAPILSAGFDHGRYVEAARFLQLDNGAATAGATGVLRAYARWGYRGQRGPDGKPYYVLPQRLERGPESHFGVGDRVNLPGEKTSGVVVDEGLTEGRPVVRVLLAREQPVKQPAFGALKPAVESPPPLIVEEDFDLGAVRLVARAPAR